jgi:hypothetical protein
VNTFAEQVARSPDFVAALVLDLLAGVGETAEGLAHAAARYCVARDHDLPDLDTARRALRTQARAAYERVRSYAGLVDLGDALDFIEETLPPDRLPPQIARDLLRALIRFGGADDLTDLEDVFRRMADTGRGRDE